MNKYTDYPGLAGLPYLVNQQRRLLAGQLRITREERALREQIDALLVAAGVLEVECDGFAVRHIQRGDVGQPSFATVTPIRD